MSNIFQLIVKSLYVLEKRNQKNLRWKFFFFAKRFNSVRKVFSGTLKNLETRETYRYNSDSTIIGPSNCFCISGRNIFHSTTEAKNVFGIFVIRQRRTLRSTSLLAINQIVIKFPTTFSRDGTSGKRQKDLFSFRQSSLVENSGKRLRNSRDVYERTIESLQKRTQQQPQTFYHTDPNVQPLFVCVTYSFSVRMSDKEDIEIDVR